MTLQECADEDFFMLTAVESVLRGARKRTESRGVHYRTDYPDTEEAWRRNIRYERADVGGMTTGTTPVGSPSKSV